VWSYGYASRPDIWFADSAATVHVSPNQDDFTSYRRYDKCWIIKAFGRNTVKAVGEGNVLADIKFRNKTTRIELTQVLHVPSVDGKILSLKRLDQKGFEIRISGGRVRIIKADETYAEAPLGGELYEVKMKIIPMQDNEPGWKWKRAEVWGTDPTRRPEHIIAHGVSKEAPIMNDTCNMPIGNGTRTCSCEEDLMRDMHQEAPQLHLSKHAATSATSAPTPDTGTLQ